HSGRLERWLGAERVENLSKLMKGWYGAPIHILDCPGTVLVCGDGDFIGNFERGYFMSAMDSLWHLWKRAIKYNENVFYTGFASISDALSRASKGYGYSVNIYKAGSTGVAGVTNSLWRAAGVPAAGNAPAGAPNGTVFTSSSTGAISYPNPSSGTMHLVGADISASVANNALLLYDLLFGCNKTMNSTDPETVTGVPTRYQSTTATDPDYAGSNFLFVQVGTTALASTAHNWTVCTYTNQSGNSSTLPSLTGNSGAIVHRLDHPANQWFAPLATGDVGIKALTQMQCSAAVATGEIHFMIGHPIGWMSIPLAYTLIPFDWLTSRNQAPRIFNNACLTFLEVMKPSTSATTYTGVIHMTSAAA
ncbi:MAG: hypothetical protein ACUVWN_16665, partial [bacterium]